MQQMGFTVLHMLVVAPVLLGFTGNGCADVFQSVDAQGVVHLSNIPTSTGYQLLVHSDSRTVLSDNVQTGTTPPARPDDRTYAKAVKKAAHDQHLDQALLQAIIAVESNYDPQAVSSRGAVGLMQLMPDTAQRYGVTDRYDPVENIQGGARYLHDLLQRYHDNLPLVLAAYNAGEDAVDRYGNRIPPYTETQRYVPRVMRLYRYYRTSLP